MQASQVSFANPSVNGAYEPKVVATALGSAANKLSAPVDGSAGVYVIQTTAVQEPAKQTDYSIYTFQMKQQLQGKARFAEEGTEKLANVEDDRFDFF